MTTETDLMQEAVALARMAQMFRRVGGVIPGVKEMLDSLVSDADAFLAKIDAIPAKMSGCPKCGKPEIDAMTPRTVYACESSDYDQRPGTFKQSKTCAAASQRNGGE